MLVRSLLLIILLAAGVLSGCKSTPKATVEDQTLPVKKVAPAVVQPAKRTAPVPVTFDLQPRVSSKDLQKIASKYRSISVSEFRLKEHKLHKFNFDNSVLFQFDKSDLSLVDSNELQEFAKAYSNNGTGRHLYVVGHTDSRGNRAYNQSLSVRRAMVIATILERHGVPHSLIKLVPAGEVLPISTNATDKGRAKNRRVEILSADSKELVKAFLRQADCSSIDSACSRAILPIMDLERKGPYLHIRSAEVDTVITQTPELNHLQDLAQELTIQSADYVDNRYSKLSEAARIANLGKASTREALHIKITKRESLIINPDIRKPLILSERYYLKL